MNNQYYLEFMIKERAREIELEVRQNNLISSLRKKRPKTTDRICLAAGRILVRTGEYLKKLGTSLSNLNKQLEDDCLNHRYFKTFDKGSF